MNNYTDQLYKELEEIDSRIYFIEDVYKTILKQVYQIHPDFLNFSENKVLLSNFIKNFHNQSILYCQKLQHDLESFMSIIKKINETKFSLKSSKTTGSITDDFLQESLISQNANVRSTLTDQPENKRLTVDNIHLNECNKDVASNLPMVSTPNGHKNFSKENTNNDNLIDFSSDSIEKSSPIFEFKLSNKTRTNVSYSSLSMSQSAGKSSKLSDPSKLKKLTYYLLDSSNKFDCFVSHVVSPFLFFIQYKDVFYRKEIFEKKFNLFYDDPINNQNTRIESIDESLIYAGRYSEDKKWYRAKIISIDEIGKNAEVIYIDYGNSEILRFEDIRFLDEIFYKESIFALPVSLAMAMPVDGSSDWSDEALNEFSNLALYRWSKIETFMIKKWPIYFCHIEIKLDNQRQDALEYLQARKLAIIENNLLLVDKYKDKIRHLSNYYGFNVFLQNESGLNQTKNSEANNLSKKQGILESDNGGECRRKASVGFKYGERYRFTIDDLPRKKIQFDSNKTFLFKICGIYSTNEFYVNLLDENFDKYDLFEKEMTEFYEKNQSYLARFAAKKKYDFLFLDSICVAFSPRDNLWYRAKITNMDKSLIRVIYIDYGTCDYLKHSNLYPLSKQFTLISPITFLAKLSTDFFETWTESDLNNFVNLVYKFEFFRAKVNFTESEVLHHFNKALELDFLSAYDQNENESSLNLRELTTGGKNANEIEIENFESASCFRCFQDKSLPQPLKIDLPNEDLNLKHERIKMFIDDCTSYVTEKESGEEIVCNGAKWTDEVEKSFDKTVLKESKKTVDDLLFENWDPKAEEYNSAKNFYGFNEQNGESHAFGYETLYEKDICDYFNQFGYCNKKKCHLYHKKRTETLVPSTSKSLKIYYECFETQKKLVNTFVFLNNVRYIGNDVFEGTIIGGIDRNNNQVNFTDLAKMTNSINNYYGDKKFLPEKSTIYSIGQIVVARSNLCGLWLRAKVIKANNVDKLDLATYEVEFMDLKGSEELCLKDLYMIKEEYLNYVPSFCLFKLSNISIKTSKIKIQDTLFKAKLKFKLFWAKIKKIEDNNILDLQLFCCSDSTCIDLNDFFVNQKFAIKQFL